MQACHLSLSTGEYILVPRGRALFGQHQESRFLVLIKRSAASGDEKVANIDARLFDKSNEEKQLDDSEILSFSWLEFPRQFRSASHTCHALPVNKFRQIRPHKHNNLACWIINLLLDVLLCTVSLSIFTSCAIF